MKKTLIILANLLIINTLSYSQSVTIVPTDPVSPNKGTMDYNNSTNNLQYWNGTTWVSLNSLWALNGNNIYKTNSGFVGIGTISPETPLHVVSNIPNTITLPAPFVYTSNNSATFITTNTVYSTIPNVGLVGASVGTGSIGTGQKTNFNIGVLGIANAGANAVGVYGSASGGTANYGVYCNGSGGYTGTWTLLSDIRFKESIKKLDDDIMSKIMQMKPANYSLKTEEYKFMNFPTTRQFGFIAQDLEKVFPTLVENATYAGTGNVANNAPFEYKVVNYIGIIPILTKAIQEQQLTIESLKEDLMANTQKFSKEITDLKAMISSKKYTSKKKGISDKLIAKK